LGRPKPPLETEAHELIEREQRQRRRLAALLDVSRLVASSLDPHDIFEIVADKMGDLIGATEVTIFVLEEGEQVLRPLVARTEERYYDHVMRMRLKVGEGITGTVALTGVGESIPHAEVDPRAAQVTGTPEDEATSLICVPFSVKDRVAGVITLSRQGVNQFDPEDFEIVTIFAGHCSVAIANARLYADLRRAFEELHAAQNQLVQSAKLNALGEMASGVAHDFNNMLAAILGRTQLLLQRVNEPELRRSIELIDQTARDGAHTVRRIQEFTRVRHDEAMDEVDLNAALRDVVELTRPSWQSLAKARGAAIVVEWNLKATRPVAGNAGELREVFTNLVLNAVDAMPDGGRLTLSTEDDGDRVAVTLDDSGCGMSDETQARCFDPFFTTKAVKGTGLGLSVAYGIVSRHHGTISVESALGHGARFRLTFPAMQGLPARGTTQDPGASPGSFHILVIDDEKEVLAVMGELLEALGQRVTTALGGVAGLAALRERCGPDAPGASPGAEPQVVFTDLGMPGVSGWDIVRELKSLRPDALAVLVTGWGVQIDIESAHARGADLLLAKPFTVDDVEGALGKLRSLVNERAAARAAARAA
jgi:signal transduction histidine kinase/ActR/RegA family two-component response regulator